MKPVIGVTSSYSPKEQDYELPEAYAQAVIKGGGIPILFPPIVNAEIDRYLSLVDGVILSGGTDVDPNIYGELPIPQMGSVDPMRDTFELKLTYSIIKEQKPVLAICRGCQVLNVAAGGSLWQDINTQIKNSLKHNQQAPLNFASHLVRLTNGSMLNKIYENEKVGVNSFHHQGIKSLGLGLTSVAWADDGTIEAVEGVGNFMVGVQWHPERMLDSEHIKIFKAFIEALK
jgi:putative glutamine amidotransferase